MADLAASAVTVQKTWYGGLGKEIKHRRLTLVLTGQGTAANAIPAAALQLNRLEGPVVLTKSDNSAIVIGAPSYDGSQLLLKNAASNAPADYTGTFEGVISGR